MYADSTPAQVKPVKDLRVLKIIDANLEASRSDGIVPLRFFMPHDLGNIKAVRLLIESGVDLNLSLRIDKKAALNYAKTEGKEVLKRMQDFLKQHSNKKKYSYPRGILLIMGYKEIAALLTAGKPALDASRNQHRFLLFPPSPKHQTQASMSSESIPLDAVVARY